MAISYVGGASSSRNGNANATTTQSLTGLTGGSNSSPSTGDLVVVCCVVGSQGRNTAQAISGYTTLGTQLNPNTTTYDTSLQVSYKVMTATPDTSITIPAQGNVADGQAWAVMVFRGIDTTTPFDVTSVSATGTATGRFNAAAITPSTSGSWIVIAGGGAAAAGAAYVAPTGFTTNWVAPAAGADTNDAMAAMGYYTGWTSGSYDPAAVTGGTTGANDSWAAWTMALKPAPEAQTLTQSSTFTNTASLAYSHTLTPGTVTLTASLFTNTNSLAYQHALISAQTLTQSSTYSDSDSLAYSHTLTSLVTLSQDSRFDGTPTFFTHAATTLTPLTQTSTHSDPDALTYAHQIVQDQVLAQTSSYVGTATYFTHQVDLSLSQSSTFLNLGNFYDATLTSSVTLSQGTTHSGSPSFYGHMVTTGEVTLSQSALSQNSQTFFAHTLELGPAPLVLTADRYDDIPDTFFTHNLTTLVTLSQTSRYDDPDNFPTHDMLGGDLTQVSIFQDGDTFFSHVLKYDQVVAQGTRYDGTTNFLEHALRNHFPDPSFVAEGVVYGSNEYPLVGTLASGYDGSLKVDLSGGKLVKLINNKVALTF